MTDPVVRSPSVRFCCLHGSLLLLLLALLACKKSQSDGSTAQTATASAAPTSAAPAKGRYITQRDLERVCKGEPLAEAKPYDSAGGGVHPTLVLLAKSEGSFFETVGDKSLDAWQTKDNKDYELVLCVTTTRTTDVKTCNLETAEGSGRHLVLQDASYDMVLYEAKTAKELAKKSVSLKVDRKCPDAWLFRHAGDRKRPDFLPTLISWAKPYAQPRK